MPQNTQPRRLSANRILASFRVWACGSSRKGNNTSSSTIRGIRILPLWREIPEVARQKVNSSSSSSIFNTTRFAHLVTTLFHLHGVATEGRQIPKTLQIFAFSLCTVPIFIPFSLATHGIGDWDLGDLQDAQICKRSSGPALLQ